MFTIIVDKCNVCPYRYIEKNGVPYCSINAKSVSGYYVIPEWCPKDEPGNKENE